MGNINKMAYAEVYEALEIFGEEYKKKIPEKFYDYIISSRNNIYSLIDIFNAIVELCYMISVNYNDMIVNDDQFE